MKYIFLPFLNNSEGKNWRSSLEESFKENEGKSLTDEINNIRQENGLKLNNKEEYIEKLHAKKSARQIIWLDKLAAETERVFRLECEKLTGDKLDSKKTTVIAALPEFFWYDINDNDKHKTDIINYHKPIYAANLINYLLGNKNPLVKLTADYPNLIFFAGTAMWKYLDPENKEDIYNTLMIFGGGKLLKVWTKVNISTIDGFCDLSQSKVMKDKIGYGTTNGIPAVSFNGKTFVFDICLDFSIEPGESPLSSKLFSGNSDVNLLISSGMPVDSAKLSLMSSPLLFRCDGNGSDNAYAEIRDKSGTVNIRPTSIGCLEINM
ncbi:hypothetical protein [Ruminococcus sp. Marseille-P6503]|uniref:hypothetical protein n=1 Tax=Ruminococcus sp. Marseille-P6503 TaxID=2364796 RepID=UPI000F534E98|nr:hypothetical protein [Ruminococcus sp. Marseille-P6503]